MIPREGGKKKNKFFFFAFPGTEILRSLNSRVGGAKMPPMDGGSKKKKKPMATFFFALIARLAFFFCLSTPTHAHTQPISLA